MKLNNKKIRNFTIGAVTGGLIAGGITLAIGATLEDKQTPFKIDQHKAYKVTTEKLLSTNNSDEITTLKEPDEYLTKSELESTDVLEFHKYNLWDYNDDLNGKYYTNDVDTISDALSNSFSAVIKNGFSGAISFITSLPGKALQWGKDFIQGLINGIKSMVQSVIDTVSGIASKIASFLHFSAPDEGPLSEYEKWMPDFMKGLAGGIERNRKLVENAVKDVASDMVITPKVNASGYGYTDGLMAGGSMADMISGISSAVSEALTGFSGQQGNIVIPVYVGGTLLDELVVTAQARQNLRSGGR